MNNAPRASAALALLAPLLLALGPALTVPGASSHAVAAQDVPEFTPFTVAPALLNQEEVVQALMREYPSTLRDAGIGGVVAVWFHVDAEGRVQTALVATSSGLDELDQAALNVANVYRFSPAMNREARVAVWISLPITFAVRRPPTN